MSTGASVYEGQKAQSQQKKAAKAQSQQADLQNAQQQRQAIRQSRIAYANAQQAGENQGVSGSSGSEGGLGSIQSQLSQNLSFLDQVGGLQDQAAEHLGRARQDSADAGLFGQFASLGTEAATSASPISKGVSKVFGSPLPRF